MPTLKTAKQKAFVQRSDNYRASLDAFCSRLRGGLSVFVAAEMAGLRLEHATKPGGFYVYLLVDPRDDSVFYVGKGSKKRCFSHEAEARADGTKNARKLGRIRDIIGAHKTLVVLIVKDGLTEADALNFESHLIANIGRTILTNGVEFAEHGEQTMWRTVVRQLFRAMPFFEAIEKMPSDPERDIWLSIIDLFRRVYHSERPKEEWIAKKIMLEEVAFFRDWARQKRMSQSYRNKDAAND